MPELFSHQIVEGTMTKQPFEGIRICDLSQNWSGPYCAAYLGGLGAEVIKIESIQHPDSYRVGILLSDFWWEVYGPWNCTNVNKYGVTLDLNNPIGKEIFKKLVKVSDIVIENFSSRVMENFGLPYEELKKLKNDIIMVSLQGYGQSGPWRDHATFGLSFEQSSGLAYITGYEDGSPLNLGGSADAIAGMHAAFAIQAALEYRERTGKGQFIEIAQAELLTRFLGAPLIDYSFNKRIWGRLGNHDPYKAPHGVYRCKGEDMWVAISVSSDEEWTALCQVIGKPELAVSEKFITMSNRLANQDILDKLIEAWTTQHDRYEAMRILQEAGVAAGALTVPDKLQQEPHLKDRGFFQELTRDITGTQLYPRWPIKFTETPINMKPAPKLGEHNEYVLGTILGLSKPEIEELEKNKIIGTVPLASGKALA
jgi:crotonobetainyl-CoA:carnitine CoA-transferase CaiB-like acyl-CoA transferase